MPAHTCLNAGIGLVGRFEEVHDLVAKVADVVCRRRAVHAQARTCRTPARRSTPALRATGARRPRAARRRAGAAGRRRRHRPRRPASERAAGRASGPATPRRQPWPPRSWRGGRRRCRRDCGAASADSRVTVRIVPSTGRITAPYAASAALVSALANSSAPAPSGGAALHPSASARRTWDRITPELPRAPISEPRLMAWHTAAMSSAVDGGDRVAHRIERERHVRAGVAVGHRIHIEAIDPLFVRFQGVTKPFHDRDEVRRRQTGQGRHWLGDRSGACYSCRPSLQVFLVRGSASWLLFVKCAVSTRTSACP